MLFSIPVLATNADPNKMLHYDSFHLGHSSLFAKVLIEGSQVFKGYHAIITLTELSEMRNLSQL